MDKFLEFVADIMEVDASEISMDTLYKEGKWDSIMMLTLIMEIEAEYKVSIPIEKVGNVKTMADLYAFVK
ncbi:MAG: acyl carrier protein [Hungatella sp.]|nr:acyl carrier protein [Hungatella sp.]